MAYGRFIGNVPCLQTGNNEGLYDYLVANGLEVIDNRNSGGALWVVGTRSQIGATIRTACSKFYAGGTWMEQGGRAVGRRPAWFTKCSR